MPQTAVFYSGKVNHLDLDLERFRCIRVPLFSCVAIVRGGPLDTDANYLRNLVQHRVWKRSATNRHAAGQLSIKANCKNRREESRIVNVHTKSRCFFQFRTQQRQALRTTLINCSRRAVQECNGPKSENIGNLVDDLLDSPRFRTPAQHGPAQGVKARISAPRRKCLFLSFSGASCQPRCYKGSQEECAERDTVLGSRDAKCEHGRQKKIVEANPGSQGC